ALPRRQTSARGVGPREGRSPFREPTLLGEGVGVVGDGGALGGLAVGLGGGLVVGGGLAQQQGLLGGQVGRQRGAGEGTAAAAAVAARTSRRPAPPRRRGMAERMVPPSIG